MKRRVLAVAGMAAVAAACAPNAASAATHTVFAGADGVVRNAPKQYTPNAFFRRTVTIHVGDSVRWQFRGFHTVTIPARGRARPPLVILDASKPVTGQVDAAGVPFWFNGQPSPVFNPLVAAPQGGTTYTGRRLVNSGLPQGNAPKPFTVRFTRAGVFPYFCAVHPGMRGTVIVRGASRRIPSEGANRRERTREIEATARQGRRTNARPATHPGTVEVGRSPTGSRFSINAFFPANTTVKVGSTVTFTMAGESTLEIHTVTFRPTNVGDVPFVTPQGAINPVAAFPSDPPPILPPYTGVNHGNGFLNSGLLDNVPATPQPNTTRVTFATPGTFHYECTVHEGMEGTVTVTP
jgi:plastocyanin